MSFTLDPALYTFAPGALDCAHCFAAGATPLQRIICATGISFGTGVPGVDPDPPNGVQLVTTTIACTWTTIGPVYFHGYATSDIASELNITQFDGPPIMFHGVGGGCQTWFANTQLDPLVFRYVGGFATIIHVQDTDPFSIATMLEFLNFRNQADGFGRDIPLAGDLSVLRLSEPSDHSNLKIKVSHA